MSMYRKFITRILEATNWEDMEVAWQEMLHTDFMAIHELSMENREEFIERERKVMSGDNGHPGLLKWQCLHENDLAMILQLTVEDQKFVICCVLKDDQLFRMMVPGTGMADRGD